MKKNKIGLIFITVLLVACVALVATACNGDKGDGKPTTYTISFVVEGETIAPIVSEPGLDITPPTAPEKDGKSFLGWFLNNEGEAVALPTIMPAQNRVYYARYEDIIDDTVRIPEEYSMKLSEVGEDNHLYIDLNGITVYLEFNDTVIKSELSEDGGYVEFSLNKKDYCAVLDGTKAEYQVCEYGYSKDAYALYNQMDDTFFFESCLYFGEGMTFTLHGENLLDRAKGTYTVANQATKEYELTIDPNYDYTYGLFTDCKVRLFKRVRQSGDTGSKPLIYNAYNVFEKNIYGTFTSVDENETLTLDGYGYATYTSEDGSTVKGLCEETTITGFKDSFINFINNDTKETSIYLLSSGTFMAVGKEAGLYRVYDVVDFVAGSYYFLIDGLGEVYVYYGARKDYYPETEVAHGTYEKLEDGEMKYTFTELINNATIEAPYDGTFNFKFTTYGSGLYETAAFAIYNPEIAGTWTDEKGSSTIVLDGYGNASHREESGVFTGEMQINNELHLFLITDADLNQQIFRFNDDNGQITFRQIGLEIGKYDIYSYANGFDETRYIYFDGENHVDYYVYDFDAKKFDIAQSGTYKETENEDEYDIEFEDDSTLKLAIRQLNFGDYYTPDWRTLCVLYDESFDITYTGADGAMLKLDGYGFNATFRDSDGFVFEGEFAKEWNLITLLVYDEEGATTVYTFKITGNTFEQKTNEAGVYYNYLPSSELATDTTRIILGGDGTAYYSHYDRSPVDAVGREATYTFEKNVTIGRNVYTLTFTDDNSTLKFATDTIGTTPIFSEYDEDWAGTFTDADGYKLILDGYGKAIYKNDYEETVYCSLFGDNLDAITFYYYKEPKTFLLNRETNRFTAASEPIGIYYPYELGEISGRTRMIIDRNDRIEIQTFSDDSLSYVSANIGTYVRNDKVYFFTSTNGGENFSFKLSELSGYAIYRTYDGFDTTPLKGEMTLKDGSTRVTTLTLDSYGSAVYDFYYYEDGDTNRYSGYYYYSEELGYLVFVATSSTGVEYGTYYIEVDWENHTFEIISEE